MLYGLLNNNSNIRTIINGNAQELLEYTKNEEERPEYYLYVQKAKKSSSSLARHSYFISVYSHPQTCHVTKIYYKEFLIYFLF